MWSPSDKYALPSPEDMINAQKAIENLETVLRYASDNLDDTNEQRLLEVGRDLEERRAWIAPIRKVPMEVLSDILLRASEIEDLAPIVFTAVSRLWRSAILAMPKAWSFIDLPTHYEKHLGLMNQRGYHRYFPGYTNTYFERSNPRVLHLAIPKSGRFPSKDSIRIIDDCAHRIQCLTVSTKVLIGSQSAENCQQFPHLRTLFLTGLGYGGRLDTSFFNVTRFPVLRHLHWPQSYRLTDASPTLSSVSFPPLQHLSLEIGSFSLWVELLQLCAATLKTLRVGGLRHPYPECISISFPLLRSLTITSGSLESPPRVTATTPVLASLIIDDGMALVPAFFEVRTDTVSHLRWCGLKMPFPCAGVRVIQIEVIYGTPRAYKDYANQLRKVATAYPLLQTIEISLGKGGDSSALNTLQRGVEAALGDGVVKDMLLWTEEWKIELPEYSSWIVRRILPPSVRLTQ
jgi:hypothetical protein